LSHKYLTLEHSEDAKSAKANSSSWYILSAGCSAETPLCYLFTFMSREHKYIIHKIIMTTCNSTSSSNINCLVIISGDEISPGAATSRAHQSFADMQIHKKQIGVFHFIMSPI
jgi:hypothetical protein